MSAAAASHERPRAIAAQNRTRSSRRPTGGRPGERSLARSARSERCPRVLIATSSVEVLRGPIESAQYASAPYRALLAQHGAVQSMSRRGDCYDSAVAESFFATLEHELLADADFASHDEARRAIFEFAEAW